MKQFLKNLLLFSSPFLLVIAYLFSNSSDRSFAYHYIEKDCGGHGKWVYNRIFKNPKPVDIAFIGSSRTIHGIMDWHLENQLTQINNDSLHLLNLGYCRLGRNMDYLLLKELLKTKQPKIVILEVREDGSRYSHPIFPYLAESQDVLWPVAFFNRDIFKDAYLALETRFEYQKKKLLKQLPSVNEQAFSSYGYGMSQNIADTVLLQQKKSIRIQRAKKAVKGIARSLHMQYSRKYLAKIATLAKHKNIQLFFLYLPEYGTPIQKPLEFSIYKHYGTVWIPPHSILTNSKNWMDDGHLNDFGAKELSNWLLQKLQ